ncbi:hypothetical protein [Aminobacter niigataensis]|uniref:hypothetical protein n=1 Tax=Aminobacter niigataensis TaxID=83265 RepID=UPI0024C6E5B8|nr:hypothetical protein [Aminobacter niigataensis]CAI2936189.1 conserved protein of unknown function [Aminobacter niigataensis]
MPVFDEIHSLQFVWFTSGEPPHAVDVLLHGITGSEPDHVQRFKPPAAPVPVSLAASRIDDADIRIQIAPGRVDLTVTPADAMVGSDTARFESNAVVTRYVEKAKAISGLIGAAFRQSIVIKAAKKVASEDEVGAAFTELLGMEADLTGAADLSFSINRRVEFDGVTYNRVLRWQAETTQLHQVMGGGHLGGIPDFGAAPPIARSTYMTYILDINTVPLTTLRQPAELEKVFDRISAIAFEALKFERAGDLR